MTKTEKVIKELRWLQFNFPWQDNPENDADKMFNAIHKYTGDAIELLESQQWINVKDRLPDKNIQVLVCDIHKGQYTASYDDDGQWNDGGYEYSCGPDIIEYWMPLPESPKEDV